MSEIESPETFWAHLCSHVTRYDAKHGLRSRDAAIRAEALRIVAGMRSEVDAAKAHLAWRAAGAKGFV